MVFFEKSQPAPFSLETEKAKENGNYLKPDILSRISSDFKSKCYICELKLLTTINVEHFIPHKGDKELKFSWENLFWSCGHCNKIKSDSYTNILNCTIKSDGVDSKIKYKIDLYPTSEVELEAVEDSSKVKETIRLLNAVYNGSNSLKEEESRNLRKLITKDILDFNEMLINYYETDVPENKQLYLAKIKDHLSRSSSFTAFKRWIILDRPKLKAEFEQYFD